MKKSEKHEKNAVDVAGSDKEEKESHEDSPYVLCPFRMWVIMAHHNFLSFVAGSNV